MMSFSLTPQQFHTLINAHKQARKNNNLIEMEAIEDKLTDLNFHFACGLIMAKKYEKAHNSIYNVNLRRC